MSLVRFQSCAQAQAFAGKCIRINLQGNGGYSVARRIESVTCGGSPSNTPSPTPQTTPKPTPTTPKPTPTTPKPTPMPTPGPQEEVITCSYTTFRCLGASELISFGNRNQINTTVTVMGSITFGSDNKFDGNILQADRPCQSNLKRASFFGASAYVCPTGKTKEESTVKHFSFLRIQILGAVKCDNIAPIEFGIASGPTLNIPPNTVHSLQPGFHGIVNVGSRATLVLQSGQYVFANLTTASDSFLNATGTNETAATDIFVNGKVILASRTTVVGNIYLISAYESDAANNNDAAISIGSDLNQGTKIATLSCLAPTGWIALKDRVRVAGIQIAKRIFFGDDVVVNLRSCPF